MTESDGPRPDFVQSLARGLAVIRAFDASQPEMTLSEVARRTDLTRAAARRFLLTLVELGYVRSDGRVFALRPRVLELGYAFLSSLSLPEVAEPHLETLVADIHESASVSVLDGGDIVYVARVPTSRIMTVAITIGTRFPAYCTSMGRVLLAALDPQSLEEYLKDATLVRRTSKTLHTVDALRTELVKVRTNGYALVDQELEEGLRSVAVPLRDRTGDVVAAANVSLQANRGTVDWARREIVPKLRATAGRIESDLKTAQPLPRLSL